MRGESLNIIERNTMGTCISYINKVLSNIEFSPVFKTDLKIIFGGFFGFDNKFLYAYFGLITNC